MSAEQTEESECAQPSLLEMDPQDPWWERDEWGWPRHPLRLSDVSFAVDCRTQPRRRGTPHIVTLTDGWELETGHDLDAERVAVALGSYSTCVQLADHLLPAARDHWLHVHRLVPPAITRRGNAWVVAQPVPGCSCLVASPTSADRAADHLRGISHWAAVHDVKRVALKSVCEQIGRVLDDAFSPASWADHHYAGRRLTDPAGVRTLWEAGIPPKVILAVTDMIAPHGEPMDARLVREVALHRIGAQWLAHFEAGGPALLNWALTTYCPRDVEEPACRFDWLALGLHPFDVTTLMSSTWRPEEIHEIAHDADVPPRRAGEAAAAWWRLEIQPEAYDLMRLLRAGVPTKPNFGREHVIRLRSAVSHVPDPPEFTATALILQASGTLTTAETLINFGVRTVDAALELL
ncbi:MAG: hypothetical protein V9G04_18360 [Nocardioides sp.]